MIENLSKFKVNHFPFFFVTMKIFSNLFLEQQQCHQAELDDFFRLVDKRLVSDIEESSNQKYRLVSILEVYEHELDRLRQIIRINDDTVLIDFYLK
jgi:hypothetical protein